MTNPPPPLATVHDPLPWLDDAACKGHNPEVWYVPTLPNPDRDVWVTARTICKPCPAREACLAYALDNEQGMETRHGMWGGLAPEERAALVRQQRRRSA